MGKMADQEYITKEPTREIIEDFAHEIIEKRQMTARPRKAVILFRDEHTKGIEREVWEVPTRILRYRKDNGRISSDVLTYEKDIGPINENTKKVKTSSKSS